MNLVECSTPWSSVRVETVDDFIWNQIYLYDGLSKWLFLVPPFFLNNWYKTSTIFGKWSYNCVVGWLGLHFLRAERKKTTAGRDYIPTSGGCYHASSHNPNWLVYIPSWPHVIPSCPYCWSAQLPTKANSSNISYFIPKDIPILFPLKLKPTWNMMVIMGGNSPNYTLYIYSLALFSLL